MSRAKKLVLERITEMVCRYVPASEAIVGTLGGVGLEAEVWHEAGIDPKKSYLIDHDSQRMKTLLRRHQDTVQILGSLETFSSVFCACDSDRCGLDFFHLDLCGTIIRMESNMALLFPLIFKSRARCFAITVADGRRNPILENPARAHLNAARLYPDLWWTIWQRLCSLHNQARINCLQTAETEKVALRELGLLISVAASLQDREKDGITCDRVERYVYSSDGFRMRTYFFHFAQSVDGPQSLTATLANRLIESSCTWLDQQGNTVGILTTAGTKPETNMNREEEIKQIRSRLSPILGMMNADIRRDMERLAVLAGQGIDQNVLDQAIAILQSLKSSSATSPAATASVNPPEPPTAETPASEPVKRGRGRPRKERLAEEPTNLHGVSIEQKDNARFALLEARMQGNTPEERQSSLNAAIEYWSKEFGITGAPNRFNIFQGIIARAQGGFESEFMARILVAEADGRKRNALAAKLAKLYGCTKDQVLESAGKHRIWQRAQNGA